MGLMEFYKRALKNLVSKPVTLNYPAEPRTYFQRTRGHIELDITQCVLCGSCARHCPTDTIKVDRKTGTWSMNRFDCVQCGNCVGNCPKKCLTLVPGYFAPGTEKVTERFEKPQEKQPSYPIADLELCKFCGLCGKKCPNDAIVVDRKTKCWTLNQDACVGCGLCKDNCHFGAITMK